MVTTLPLKRERSRQARSTSLADWNYNSLLKQFFKGAPKEVYEQDPRFKVLLKYAKGASDAEMKVRAGLMAVLKREEEPAKVLLGLTEPGNLS
ncbi:hypothetical protein PC116_g12362 [Phytophthora cactorum]|nr:hypothetical protein PC111_g7914 [Phytophthora cactorum]KAG3002022.1 hypothetical protein PC120_g19942 [Phytophthora cactorum]KAG3022127.1 hypothetical protein PC119_g9393 [Phytophthora cactorum]KAG3088101.1 hypothetical protein PC122_g8550 [Phytophthora cactorum]KAG4239645.1 hypothetical protein PC116_g12362 [Phytophthora cactorum]